MGEEEDDSLPPSLPSFLGIIDKDGLIRSALSAEPLARRMTMEVDNNGGRKRTLARGRRGGRRGRRLRKNRSQKLERGKGRKRGEGRVREKGRERKVEGGKSGKEKSWLGHSCNPRNKSVVTPPGIRGGEDWRFDALRTTRPMYLDQVRERDRWRKGIKGRRSKGRGRRGIMGRARLLLEGEEIREGGARRWGHRKGRLGERRSSTFERGLNGKISLREAH